MKMKRLVSCIFMLCLITSAFADTCVPVAQDEIARKANDELAAKMLQYMEKNDASKIESLFIGIPYCREGSEGECISRMFDSVKDFGPGAIQLLPRYAFSLAAKKYFKGKAGLLDYNKMAKVYDQHGSWSRRGAGYVINLMRELFNGVHDCRSDEIPEYAALAFRVKSQEWKGDDFSKCLEWLMLLQEYDRDDRKEIMQGLEESSQKMKKYQYLAEHLYGDLETFNKVKWSCSAGAFTAPFNNLRLDVLGQTKFWDTFAVSPAPAKPEAIEKVQDGVRAAYTKCINMKEYGATSEVCRNLKIQAGKYGYWRKTQAEIRDDLKTEMKAFVVTQPRR